MAIDPALITRLSLFLGMMGSNHDGEALAAARKAETLRASLKLGWADLLAAEGTVRQLRDEVDNLRTALVMTRQENCELRDELADAHQALERLLEHVSPAQDADEEPGVQEMCEYLIDEGDLPEGLEEFVESLANQYARRHRLTDKQLAALRRIYEKNREWRQ